MAKMGQGSLLKLGQFRKDIHAYHTKDVNPHDGDIQSSGKAPGRKLHGKSHVKSPMPNNSHKTGKRSRKIVITA